MKKSLYPSERKGKGRANWERLLSQANELRFTAGQYGLLSLHHLADEKLHELFADFEPRAVLGEETVKPCPMCGGVARRERPDLFVADATCTACGAFFTSSEASTQSPAGEL
jgi:hypothetical protein